MTQTFRVVALDGPSASGKSSTARAVARALGWAHLDSGALYRAVTRLALDLGESPFSTDHILAAAELRGLELRETDGEYVPWMDGQLAEGIRTPEVDGNVSSVAAMPRIRDWVNARLRAAVAASDRAVVMDGRDIGTAVFPDAALKVYVTAEPEVRARRRLVEDLDGEGEPPADRLREETFKLSARDAFDAGRPVAPLRRAEDAVLLDTSALTFEEQVERIVALVRKHPALGGTRDRG